jgi:heat shock protein HtpX
MITALRKIENRGELDGVTSAVMEMCVDNPRAGFADMFATHPSIDSRVDALVRMAGGRDPGPIAALPEPGHLAAGAEDNSQGSAEPQQQGPWSVPRPTPEPGGSDGPWGAARG